MFVEDAVLPAAAHLTGPGAEPILAAAVEAAGGRLERARACHLQYRPGHDVVVRFSVRVSWRGSAVVDETLVAATTVAGSPAGTVRVDADLDGGRTLSVGVWRWPFDPVVTGLDDAVTPSTVADLLAGVAVGRVRLEVVSYRPTLRAVVRAVDEASTTFYVKAVPPADAPELVERHRQLAAAGLPVPVVVCHDQSRGLVAMTALVGPTIRDRLKWGVAPLPGGDAYDAVAAALADVELAGACPVAGRAATADHHAAVLAAVLPREQRRLERLRAALAPAAERAEQRRGPTIHGDLYEAQLVTGRGPRRTATITGLLDLDEAGPGDPVDDRATVVAHLISRALEARGERRRRAAGYAGVLRRAFRRVVDAGELDLVIAGTLVGLATGPFRLQQRHWPEAVRRHLAVADRLTQRPGEQTLTVTS